MATNPHPELGSLAQSARSKQLNMARGILLFIGILTVIVNAVFFAMIEQQVDNEIQAEIRKLPPGMAVNQAEVARLRETAISLSKLIQGGAIALGAVFIVLGLLVKKHPVPMTVTGLVLYIGAAVVFGFINPQTLYMGWIVKLLIIAGLVKSIQSAVAYQREQQNLAMQAGQQAWPPAGEAPTS